jgi:hypothetical protein
MRRPVLILILAASCGGAAAPVADPSPGRVTGLITEVRFDGDEVVSFVLETRDESHDLLIDPEYDYGFNLRHLEVHRQQELPVHVEIVPVEGALYAHEVLDA